MTGNETERMSVDVERNGVNLINRYLALLFFIFLFYSVFIIVFFGDMFVSIFLMIITFFWLILIAVNKKTNHMEKIPKTFDTCIFVLLTFIVSFFNTYTYKNAGVEYFYFCLLFAVPFFFNYKKDSFFIFFIVFIISINFIGCIYFDFDFLPRSTYLKETDLNTIRLWNILFAISSFLMDVIFITQKDMLIRGLMVDTKRKDSKIRDLVKTNAELMKHQMLSNYITEDDIQEIVWLAENNSPLFFEKFQIFFPHFFPDILEINPKLIHSELHYCALMKLDFDTKKIAQCTNNSVRAVESKKYRIRKKLSIPSEVNINSFIIKI